MKTKVKFTRPELKRYRDAMARYERFLPMLKLKQQQLQLALRETVRRRRNAARARDEIVASIHRYRGVLADRAGIPLTSWSQPTEVKTRVLNVAGVDVPVLDEVLFPQAEYSLFGTPPWVDRTLKDLRERSRREAAVDVMRRAEALLRTELNRIVQRVNLFEKIMIPQTRDAIRRIRIQLGDEMTAAVGRAKIAKGKLTQTRSS